jgi:hypothetical protein
MHLSTFLALVIPVYQFLPVESHRISKETFFFLGTWRPGDAQATPVPLEKKETLFSNRGHMLCISERRAKTLEFKNSRVTSLARAFELN